MTVVTPELLSRVAVLVVKSESSAERAAVEETLETTVISDSELPVCAPLLLVPSLPEELVLILSGESEPEGADMVVARLDEDRGYSGLKKSLSNSNSITISGFRVFDWVLERYGLGCGR